MSHCSLKYEIIDKTTGEGELERCDYEKLNAYNSCPYFNMEDKRPRVSFILFKIRSGENIVNYRVRISKKSLKRYCVNCKWFVTT